MDWYKYYQDQLKTLDHPDVFDYKDLYLSILIALIPEDNITMNDLRDLTKAYLEKHEEEIKNESTTTAV